MELTRYPSYKPSGIEWVGKMPSHWGSERLKFRVSINDDVLEESTPENFQFTYVDIGGVSEGRITSEQVFSFAEAPSRARRLVNQDDIIISTVRTYLKAIARIDEHHSDRVVSTGFAVLRSRGIDPKYLSYYVTCDVFIQEIVRRSVGVSYPGINASEIGNIKILVPNPEEQTAIATYLDEKTAKIDKLIAGKQRMIELLKEERMAIINEAVSGEGKGWERKKLKYWINSVTGGGTPSTSNPGFWNGSIPWVSPKDMKEEFIVETEDYVTEEAVSKSATNLIPPNRVLVVVRSGILKHTFPIAINRVEVTLNQDLKALEPTNELSVEFLYWKLTGLSNEILSAANKMGATVDSIDMYDLMEFPLSIPDSKVKQGEIIEKVRSRMEELDNLNTRISAEINLLTENRAAIINEVVTGKLKVV